MGILTDTDLQPGQLLARGVSRHLRALGLSAPEVWAVDAAAGLVLIRRGRREAEADFAKAKELGFTLPETKNDTPTETDDNTPT